MNLSATKSSASPTELERLRDENQSLRSRLDEVTARLEELEGTFTAIQEGQVDAVVVDRQERPEIWTLETSDKLHLDLVLQAANAGTWHWEVETSTVLVSKSMLHLWGLPPDTNANLDVLLSVVHPDDRDQTWVNVQSALESAENDYYHEYRIVRGDHQIRWIATRGRIVRNMLGKAERVLGVSLDVTERRQAEETLRQADRRKDEFLAMLAHELRNPLAAVTNAIQLSRVASLPAGDRQWIADMLDRQMAQLGRLVDDLLDMARITSQKIQLKKENVALTELVSRVVDSVRPRMEQARHELHVDFPDGPVWVFGDPQRLDQVLTNLLANAAKYTPEGGKVWLSIGRQGTQAVISVKDTGIGIAPELLPRVFDLFSQGEQGLDRSQGGLGVGLSLVRRLVEMHGGKVSAASEGPGMGSEFTVRLAAVGTVNAELPSAGKRQLRANRALKILVVDDNEDAALTLSLLLKASGHETNIAHSGRQAMALMSEFQPVVALLDIGLPEMNGYELALQLRNLYPTMFLVAVSGYGQSADRERATQAGFNHHFVKPVKLDDLLEVLHTQVAAA